MYRCTSFLHVVVAHIHLLRACHCSLLSSHQHTYVHLLACGKARVNLHASKCLAGEQASNSTQLLDVDVTAPRGSLSSRHRSPPRHCFSSWHLHGGAVVLGAGVGAQRRHRRRVALRGDAVVAGSTASLAAGRLSSSASRPLDHR